MKLHDLVNMRGEVLIQGIGEDGSISTLMEDKNLIVTSGRMAICNALNGSSFASIQDIHFGSGGTVTGNTSVAKPVNPTDTDVIAPIAATKGVDYSFSTVVEQSPSPRIIFSTVVPKITLNGQPVTDTNLETSLNGKAISELALALNTTPTSTAFAIKRFASISKSNTISLLITWTIYI
jgi:hypothetical protein